MTRNAAFLVLAGMVVALLTARAWEAAVFVGLALTLLALLGEDEARADARRRNQARPWR